MNRAGNERTGRQALVLPVKAGISIVEGTMVALGADGYAVPAGKATGLVAAGVCQEYADNTAGADGDAMVQVRRGAFVMGNAGDIEMTDILKPCYFSDETTVTLASEGSSIAGRILQVDDDGITVDFMI